MTRIENRYSYKSPKVKTLDIKPEAVLCASPFDGDIDDLEIGDDGGSSFR